jgi:hypothetical protein
MNYLPAQRITQGEPFGYEATVVGQDWTGWTGTATYKTRIKATEAIVTVDVAANSAGLLEITLTAAQTALLPGLPRMGYFRTAVCEIAMSDGAGDVKLYQAPVSVAAQI